MKTKTKNPRLGKPRLADRSAVRSVVVSLKVRPAHADEMRAAVLALRATLEGNGAAHVASS